MAVNIEAEQIINQGQIFEFNRHQNSRLVAIEIPLMGQKSFILLTYGLETIHITLYQILPSSYDTRPKPYDLPDRYIEETGQLAPLTLIYRYGKRIKKVPRAFRVTNPSPKENLFDQPDEAS